MNGSQEESARRRDVDGAAGRVRTPRGCAALARANEMSARRNSPDALDFLANETIALAMDEARYSHEGVDGSSGGGAGAA